MTFAIPKSKASIGQNRFEFTFPGEKKKYSLPLLKFLKPSLAEKFEGEASVGAGRALFDAYYPDDDLLGKFDDAEQLEAFLEAYVEASGITVGESEGSDDS